jgi:hypothetical protein
MIKMRVLPKISEISGPPMRVTIKYILLQIPALIVFSSILILVRLWLEIPEHVLWIFFGAFHLFFFIEDDRQKRMHPHPKSLFKYHDE